MSMQAASSLVDALMKESELNRSIWTEVLGRGKNKREVDIDRLRRNLSKRTGITITRQEFIATFKGYQKKGLGKLVSGQGDKPSFTFRLNEYPSAIQDDLFGTGDKPKAGASRPQVVLGGGKYVFVHTLQSGVTVRIELPGSITRQDLENLANGLRQLI